MIIVKTKLRQNNKVSEAEWRELESVGYVRLGVVLPSAQIDRLCNRIDQIMLGNIRYEGMGMQLCPSGSRAEQKTRFSAKYQGSSLKYRKIQELEMDPLFLNYIQHPLFRDITQKKIGEKVDSSQFKTILAMLLLLVGIAIAYDTFFVEEVIKETSNNGSKTLGPISQFVRDLSKNVPVLYGLFSIVLALVLGVGAAILRRFLSNLKKKFVYTAPPASQK